MLNLRTNTASQKGATYLNINGGKLQTAIERLSSGLRVNSAKDDAAGQAIGNRMTAQVRGNAQAARNANDGISMAQTASGGLDGINTALQRIRELAVQGLNGTLSASDGDAVQAEINANLREINRIAEQTQFNGTRMLSQGAMPLALQVGSNDNDQLSVNFPFDGFGVRALGLEDLNIAGIDGEITPVTQMPGTASRIQLGSASTSVNYSLPAGSSNGSLVLGNNGTRYIQATDSNGRAVYYAANVSATHDTASRTSQVNITAGAALYTDVLTVGGMGGAQSLRDDTGAAFTDGLARSLVRADGKYWIRATDGMGAGVDGYVEATLSYSAGVAGMVVQATGATMVDDSGFSAAPVAVTTQPSFNPASTPVDFVDNSGNPVAGSRLVRNSAGTAYMEVPDGAGGFSYYAATVGVAVDSDGNTQITARQTAAAPRTFTEVTEVNGTSTVTLSPDNVQINYVDREGRSFSGVLRSDGTDYYLDLTNNAGEVKKATVVRDQNGDYLMRTINGSNEVLEFFALAYNSATDVANDSTVMNFTEDSDAYRLRLPKDPLATIDRAIAQVDAMRGELGAVQNRLDSTISNLRNSVNNTEAARSRILDADYAVETANMVKAQIIQQAATSVLAQANQAPQQVLSLLQ